MFPVRREADLPDLAEMPHPRRAQTPQRAIGQRLMPRLFHRLCRKPRTADERNHQRQNATPERHESAPSRVGGKDLWAGKAAHDGFPARSGMRKMLWAWDMS